MVDDSTNMSWESVYKISRSWVDVLTFYVILFVVVSGLMWLCDESDSKCASNFVQILGKVLWRP
jgi:hypothetical protein